MAPGRAAAALRVEHLHWPQRHDTLSSAARRAEIDPFPIRLSTLTTTGTSPITLQPAADASGCGGKGNCPPVAAMTAEGHTHFRAIVACALKAIRAVALIAAL